MRKNPINSLLRNGIASNSLSQIERNKGGHFIYQSQSSDPTNVIKNRVTDNIVKSSNKYTFPSDISQTHFGLIESEVQYSGSASLTRFLSSKLIPQKLIRLPLPSELKDNFEVSYGTNFALNPLTTNAGPFVGGLAKAFGAIEGVTVNSFKAVTLGQPDFKRHGFSWKLSPKNYNESKTIQRILYTLRKGMTPKRANHRLIRWVLTFPHVFQMFFTPNPKYLFKFKPVVIEKMEVDYKGGNPLPTFYSAQGDEKNRPPESLTVSCVFLELEYWLDSKDAQYSDYKFDNDDPELPDNDPFSAYNGAYEQAVFNNPSNSSIGKTNGK